MLAIVLLCYVYHKYKNKDFIFASLFQLDIKIKEPQSEK